MIVVNAVLFAAAAFLASFVVVGAAWALQRGRAAAVRHLIWTGAFAALIALPLAALALPSQLTFLLPAAPAIIATTAVPAAAPVAPAPTFDMVDIIFALAALWLAGVLFHVGKLAVGAIGLIALHRRSVAHIPHGIDTTPFLGLKWQLRLRTSPGESGPLTWGVMKPVVLLPKASVAWPRERLMSVLLHESAHVRRKDCLCRLIAIVAAALYWPNPLVWFAARAQRRDAESAADDAVITAGVKPTRYAEHLVGLAREFSGAGLAMTMSMAEHRMLDTRVQAILDPVQPRRGVTKMDVLKLGVACIALIAGLALARPSLAEAADTPASDKAPVTTSSPKAKRVSVHTTVRTNGDGTRTITRVVDNGDDADMTPPTPPVPPEPVPAVGDDMAVPPAPPAPPAPHAVPVPPVPPVPPVHHLSEGERAAIRGQAQADARRAMAQARRALAEVNIQQTVEAAMKQAELALRNAKLDEAQAKKAVAGMNIDRVVALAMRKAEIALQKAEAAQDRAEARRVIIERRVVDEHNNVLTDDVAGSED